LIRQIKLIEMFRTTASKRCGKFGRYFWTFCEKFRVWHNVNSVFHLFTKFQLKNVISFRNLNQQMEN